MAFITYKKTEQTKKLCEVVSRSKAESIRKALKTRPDGLSARQNAYLDSIKAVYIPNTKTIQDVTVPTQTELMDERYH